MQRRYSCTDSPEKTPRWRVRVAVQRWVLRSQKEGQNSSSTCTERVSYYHQPIVHGALVLGQRERLITPTITLTSNYRFYFKFVHTVEHVQARKNYSHVDGRELGKQSLLILSFFESKQSKVPSLFQRPVTRSSPVPVSSLCILLNKPSPESGGEKRIQRRRSQD